MEFKIESSSWYKPEELLEHYPCLKDYSFRTEEIQVPRTVKFRDENGNLMTQEMTATRKIPYVHITSLANLMKFMKDVGYPVIVSNTDSYDSPIHTIEIYDDWRE